MKYILNSFLVILIFMFVSTSCGIGNKIFTPAPPKTTSTSSEKIVQIAAIKTGADNYENYLESLINE